MDAERLYALQMMRPGQSTRKRLNTSLRPWERAKTDAGPTPLGGRLQGQAGNRNK